MVFITMFILNSDQVCANQKNKSVQCNKEKIVFDVNAIDRNGLVGPLDGKVSVVYEFCIPYENKYLEEVKSIDPLLNCYHGSKGRIGCQENEYLCLGNTHDKDFKSKLCQLSNREYIKQIAQCFFE